jgi:hypothetical protein
MPHGDRGVRRRRVLKSSPTTSGDWTAGTIMIDYPQDDGSTKSYSYDIPEHILRQARKAGKIGPIVDYLATKISKEWADRVGADSKAEKSQYNSIKLWLWRNMQEQIMSAVQGHTKDESKFLPYYHPDELRKRKEDLKNLKKDVHPELLEFLEGRKWWFVNYSQVKAAKRSEKMPNKSYNKYVRDVKKSNEQAKKMRKYEKQFEKSDRISNEDYRAFKKLVKENDKTRRDIERAEDKYGLK